jgi:hypothetical protein
LKKKSWLLESNNYTKNMYVYLTVLATRLDVAGCDDAYDDVQSDHSPSPQLRLSSLIKTTATTLMKETSEIKIQCPLPFV